MSEVPDAVVVGAGPNGLAAALTLVRAGLRVEVYEGAAQPGGGCRTAELTLPGYQHDVCAAVHPLALASPFFASLDLPARGVRFRHPEVPYAHPLGNGAAAAYRSLDATAESLGSGGPSWRALMAPLVQHADAVTAAALSPVRGVPRTPLSLLPFLRAALASADVVRGRLAGVEVRALFAGLASHAMRPLDARPTGGVGAFLGMLGHTAGWPVVEGGSARLVDGLVGAAADLGVVIHTGRWVTSLAEIPPARAILLDLAPRQVADVGGARLPARYVNALRRFRYGPGVCKVDWALDGPVPWTAEACRGAGTVHVGGTYEEIARAEAEVAAGRHPRAPFVLVAQPGVVDPSRAPAGRHTLWGYCHVPGGSTLDMSDSIEAQIERYAPGFRDRIVARAVLTAADSERIHPNYVGGDINGGAATLRQTLFRPTVRWDNYRTPQPGLYLCSASTPPGGGVHGMCGYWAARSALRHEFGLSRNRLRESGFRG